MEPKFQSSFIPKGPLASSASFSSPSARSKSLLDIAGSMIFTIAVISSIGVFGYHKYLDYRIGKMGSELAIAREQVDSDVTHELIRLDSRLSSTQTLLANHVVVGPVFDFLEESTLPSVRFNNFSYNTTERGLELRMEGQARSYSSLALQADIFSNSEYLTNPVFSNLDLDQEGNVTFTFNATIEPTLVAYRRLVEKETQAIQPASAVISLPSATSTATSTKPATATSTATSSKTTNPPR